MFTLRTRFFLFLLLSTISGALFAQAPFIRWQATIGGSDDDVLTGMQVTRDGGYILSGYSKSNISGNKTENSYMGTYDFWVLKLDSAGNVQWNKTIGGNDQDLNAAVIQTSDGGYLTGGSSVSPISGNKTVNTHDSSYDYWLIKLNSAGQVLWQNTIGGSFTEKLTCLAEAKDGYLAGGFSYSNRSGNKKTNNLGPEEGADYWTVRVNKKTGAYIKEYPYGATNHDGQTCMFADSVNWLLGGNSYSPPKSKKKAKLLGIGDYWLVKTDATGKSLWQKTFGGALSDRMTCITKTSDAGYVAGGYSNSPVSEFKKQSCFGVTDYYIVRVSADGNMRWNKTIGGEGGDYLMSVVPTSDKGFILGGYSNSAAGDNKTTDSLGGFDYWIVKIDSSGIVQWDKTIGGSRNDILTYVAEVLPGEYIVGGTSESPVSADKITDNLGYNDLWIMRLSTNVSINKSASAQMLTASNPIHKITGEQTNSSLTMTVLPNPVKTTITILYKSTADKSANIKMMNANGQALFTAALPAGGNTYIVDVSRYPSGVYYIVLQSGQNSITRKIIKQ